MAELDLRKLAKIAGMLESDSDGERANAARMATDMLRSAGLRWADFVLALEQRSRLLDAAKKLKGERDQLQAEGERLKQLLQLTQANGGGFATQIWQNAGTPITPTSRTAQWALDLMGQGRCSFTQKESDFLNSCARRRRLSDAQKDWLEDITDRITRFTGLSPPP